MLVRMFNDIPSPARFLQALWLVVSSVLTDPQVLLRLLTSLIRRLRPRHEPEGMYAVLEHDACLELLDGRGDRALYHKRQRVRFLQDNIIAYQDKAWGDGDFFADYRCSPGVAVDRYRDGHRYRILISLRETKNRGDVEEFLIERTIRRGFTQPVEEFQTEIDHKTDQLTLRIIFPRERPARSLRLIEQNAGRTTVLGAEHLRRLPDGRQQARWSTRQPRQFEAYILRWEW